MSIGPIVFLQPVWLIIAIAMALASLALTPSKSVSGWKTIIAPSVLKYLGGVRHYRSNINIALIAATLTALSLSQPALRVSNDDTWRHSTGWVMVVDVSRSMTLNDIVPSRISAARETLATISQVAGARPVALILFAGDAFLVAPPAFDRSVFDEHAALLEHGVIPIEGSNLARALSLASSVIQGSQLIKSRVVLLTDTGGISKASIAAAKYLADDGHKVDVLVFGIDDTATASSVDTAVSHKAAEDIANAGNGQAYFSSRFGAIDLTSLDLTDQADPSTHSDLKSLVWHLQSHWILLFIIPILFKLFREEIQS